MHGVTYKNSNAFDDSIWKMSKQANKKQRKQKVSKFVLLF